MQAQCTHCKKDTFVAVEVYGLRLERAFKGKVIQPEDQNLLVDFWKAYCSHATALAAMEKLPSEAMSYVEALRSVISRMRRVAFGDFVLADDFNAHREAAEIAVKIAKEVCKANPELSHLCTGLDYLVYQIPSARGGDIISSEARNSLLNLIQRLYNIATAAAPWPGKGTVYLLPTGLGDDPLEVYHSFLRDNLIVFVPFEVPGPWYLGPAFAYWLGYYKIVLACLIWDEPCYDKQSNILYLTLFFRPVFEGICAGPKFPIADPCFSKWLGSTYPALTDCMTLDKYKHPDAVRWGLHPSDPTVTFAYLCYEKGVLIEVPYEGFWKTPEQMIRTISAFISCFFGSADSIEIVYGGHYTSAMPEWHSCYPIDACWKKICDALYWELIDMRQGREQ